MLLKLDIAEGLVGVGKLLHYKLNMEICCLASYFPFSDILGKKLQIVPLRIRNDLKIKLSWPSEK